MDGHTARKAFYHLPERPGKYLEVLVVSQSGMVKQGSESGYRCSAEGQTAVREDFDVQHSAETGGTVVGSRPELAGAVDLW